MHLTPKEHERLLLAAAADLARRRLARGSPLGATEAIALICDEVQEMGWDGMAIDEVVEHARKLLRPDQLLPGVAAAAPVVQVEALFPHGTSLVHVPQPFGGGGPRDAGQVLAADGEIQLARGQEQRSASLANRGHRDVWVSSRIPLGQLNHALTVDVEGGADPRHWRLAIPAGTSIRFAPGERRDVTVVATRGRS
ncbi:urease subunit gamma [Streptomyces sp. NPDC006356]